MITFRLDGVDYSYEPREPDLSAGVRRFTYGLEPRVIAELPLVGGEILEIHGYAEHWTKDEVCVVWSDDDVKHLHCWLPAPKVRRPADGEWHGAHVSR